MADVRHTAEDSHGVDPFTYTAHDGRYYASQDLQDGKNNVKLTVKWLKDDDGDEWAVRIIGEGIDQCKSDDYMPGPIGGSKGMD